MQRPLFRARENWQSTYKFFPILRSNLSSTRCYKGVKITRLLGFLYLEPILFLFGP